MPRAYTDLFQSPYMYLCYIYLDRNIRKSVQNLLGYSRIFLCFQISNEMNGVGILVLLGKTLLKINTFIIEISLHAIMIYHYAN